MNTITLELCAEDRARLDRLTAALEKRVTQAETVLTEREETIDPVQKALAETLAKATPSETAGNEPQATEEPAKAETLPKDEPPKTVEKTEAPVAEDKPAVTLPQIQQKVVQLCAANKGAKKPKVHAIVTAYSPTVSGLKEMPEKWSEIWDKLTALEKEV